MSTGLIITLVVANSAIAIFVMVFFGRRVGSSGPTGALVERYGFQGRFHGDLYKGRDGRVGDTSLSGTLRIGMSDRGLYLAASPLFSFVLKPVLIPWRDIRSMPHPDAPNRCVEISVRGAPQAKIVLDRRSFGDRIEDRLVRGEHEG